jgi:hypothetical protein
VHAPAPTPAHPSTFLAGFDRPTSGRVGKGGSLNVSGGGYNAWWDNGRGKGGKDEGGKGVGEKGKGKGEGALGPQRVRGVVRGPCTTPSNRGKRPPPPPIPPSSQPHPPLLHLRGEAICPDPPLVM